MELKVRNSVQALQAFLDFLSAQGLSLPAEPASSWQEKTIYAEGIEDYAVTARQFSCEDWISEVRQNVAPLARTVYSIKVFNKNARVYAEGRTGADGLTVETRRSDRLSDADSQLLMSEFRRKSSIPPPRPGGYGH